MKRDKKLNLLSDKPTTPNSKSGSKFGYKDVSSTVVDIIDASPRPFTIGLFGKWGRGKSTVLEEVRLRIDKRKYTFVKFDVWKYEGDSLRRSFLVDVAHQVNDNLGIWDKAKGRKIKPKEIEKKLYSNESAPKVNFKPNFKGLIVSGIAFFILYAITRRLETSESLSITIASIPFLVELIKSIDPTQVLQKVNIGRNPAGSPEQFEKIFKEDILSAARGTLVVAVDNLDRTQSRKTAELLSTVKTFLNSDDADENVVFLIAADSLAIKQHISNKYQSKGGSNFSADEFLQKFFNVTIDMPELIPTEVVEYTTELLYKTNIYIEQKDDVLYLISLFFNKNPREIKQFINNLVAYYIQIKNAHETYGFDETFLKNNSPFIVFLLIMREKYLDAYTKLKQDVMSGEGWSQIKSTKMSSYVKENDMEHADYKDFISKTRHVNPSTNNVAAFFSLRTSNTEKMLPGWDIFASNLESGEIDTSVKIVEEFELKALRQQLMSMLTGALNNKTRFTILSRTMLGVIAGSERLKSDNDFISAILDVILGNTQEPDVEKVFTGETLALALGIINQSKEAVRKDFIKQLAEYLKNQITNLNNDELKTESLLVESYSTPILEYYKQNPNEAASWKSQLQKMLATTTDLPIYSQVSEDEVLGKLVSDSAYTQFLESINQNSINDKTVTLELSALAGLTAIDRMPNFLLKTSDILSSTPDIETKQSIVEILSKKLIEYPESADEPAQATVNNLTRNMIDVRANIDTEESPSGFLILKGIVVISSSSTNTLTSETDAKIKEFIKDSDVSSIIELFKVINKTERVNDFDNAVIDRIKSVPMDNYPELSQLLDEDSRKSVLTDIASNIGTYTDSVEQYMEFFANNESVLGNDYDSIILKSLKEVYNLNLKRNEIKKIAHHNSRTNLKGSLKKPLRDAIKEIELSEQDEE